MLVTNTKHALQHGDAIRGIIVAVLIVVFGVLSKGATTTTSNVANILVQTSIKGVAAIGQTLVILSRGIDLSVYGIATLTGMVGGAMMTSDMDRNIVGYVMSPQIVIPLMFLVGAGFGSVNGVLVSRAGIPALIVTLGMWQVTRGIASQITGGHYIVGLPESIEYIANGSVGLVPVPIIILFSTVGLMYFVLNYTTFGKQIYATGGNQAGAWLSGIDVKRTLLIVYAIAGLFYTLANLINTSRIMTASVEGAKGLELDSIAACAVGGISLAGGVGTITGMLLGALIIGIVGNGLSVIGAGTATMAITKGAIIIVAVGIDYLRKY
jgi:ribose/xylose/arabinose/galactoside ABC-type transport system permease subunit